VCLYVLSSVLGCPLRFPHTKLCSVSPLPPDFVGELMSYLRYGVCLCIVMSNTYHVVFLFCFSLSCVPYVASFSGLSIFVDPSVFS